MMDKLSAETRAIVEPFITRYKTFAGKVTGRAQEVEAEAAAGLEELIQMSPLDANALSSGFNAVKSRFDGLGDKVESAMEKLEEEWEEATDDLELEGEENDALYGTWYGLVNESRALQQELEHWHEKVEIKKYGDWARLLYGLAEEECSKPRACPSCGAPIEISIKHAHSAIKCPHCDSVNEMDIGMATGLYYQGLGGHALAQEACVDKWFAVHKAEHDFNQFRHPTDEDRQKYLDTAQAYWTAYYEETQKLNPGFNQTIGDAVAGRMAHYAQYDNPQDQSDRAYYGELVRAVRSRDPGLIRERVEEAEDPDDTPAAVFEHGDPEGTKLVLKALYEINDEDDDFGEWLQEKMSELAQELATR